MKTLILIVIVLSLFPQSAKGLIKNGYATKIQETRLVLKNLNNIISEDKRKLPKSQKKISARQRAKLKKTIKSLEQFIYYFEFTEILLEQFRSIAPELYYEIDVIVDGNGERTDVYVKFVPQEVMQISAKGIVYIGYKKNEFNVCHSEFGDHTVSVMVCAELNPLFLLAHELGHVKYEVPNISTYIEFYEKVYKHQNWRLDFIGHSSNDPSGKVAIIYEKRYRKYHKKYKKDNQEKLEAPMVLLKKLN